MSQRFVTYEAALEHLSHSTDYERMRHVRYNADTFDLMRMEALVGALGHPEGRYRSIHVAGTKGKGSTSAMAESILRRHGLRTGLYTSPHLVDMRERIRIDGRMIDKDLMRRMIGRAADAIDAGCCDSPPTYFEVMTAVAMAAFAEAGVEAAVFEVGLGGRLDATNVVRPEVSVITQISIDHTRQLGSDLASIAREKAGIVKEGVPLVLAPQEPEADAAIREIAHQRQAPIIDVGPKPFPQAFVTYSWQKEIVDGRPGGIVTVRGRKGTFGPLHLPLAGRFQATNAACAVAAAEILLGERLDEVKVSEGLAAVDWPGRMQTFPGPVTLVLDGAHNARSISELMTAVADYFAGRPTVYVFASAADKDIDGMVKVLAAAEAQVVCTRTDNPRAAEPVNLAALLLDAGADVLAADADIGVAMEVARKSAGEGGVVVACGSLYLVGAVLERMGHQ